MAEDSDLGITAVVEPEIVDPNATISPNLLFDAGALANASQYNNPLPTIYNGTGKTENEKGDVVDWFDRDTSNQGLYSEDQPEGFTVGEQISAFFQTENTVGSYMSEESAADTYDRGFDPLDSAEALTYPELQHEMIFANNPEELTAMVNNHVRETRNREIIDASSLPATFGYSALAMTLDPALLPAMVFTGGQAFIAKIGAKGTAAMWAATAGTSEIIAEMMKHDSQKLRTPEESFMNVAAATLLSGLMGGWAGHATSKTVAKMRTDADRAVREIYSDSPEFTGPKDSTMEVAEVNEFGVRVGDIDSVGAAKAGETHYEWQKKIDNADDLALKATGLKIENINANPLVRLSKSTIPLARRMAVLLADSPYYYNAYEKGRSITGARGSVESQKRQYVASHIQAMNKINDAYLQSRGIGSAKAALLDVTKQTEKQGGQTYRQFNRELGKALRRREPTGNKLIDDSVKTYRDDVLNPIMNDAIDAGLFDEGIKGQADRYFPRLYDYDKLNAESDDRVGGFVDKVYNWISKEQDQAKMDLQMQGSRLTHHQEQAEKAFADVEKAKQQAKEAGQEYKRYKAVLKWDIDANNPEQVRQALGHKTRPLTVSTYIREHGGLIEDSELLARDVNNKSLVAITNKNGEGPDHWIERLVEEGYYDTPDYKEISHDRFYNDLAMDIKGEKIYTREVKDALMEGMEGIHNDFDYRYATEELGLTRVSTKGEINAAIARESGQELTPEKLKNLRKYARESERVARETQEKVDAYEAFAEMTPRELRDIASRTKANILGLNKNEFNEAMLPDITAFKAGALKDRKLKIDDLEIEDWLISDADDVLDFYTKSVAPQVIVAKEFGDIHLSQPIQAIRSQYAQAGNDLERRLLSEGAESPTVIKEMQKLAKEGENAVKDIEALRDKLYGQHNRPEDPNSFWNKASHYIKAVNYMRLLGAMTISAIPDLARPVMTQGFGPVIKTIGALKGNKALKEAATKDLKASGVAIDSIMTNMSNRFSDLTEFTGHRTKAERFVETTSNIFSKATGMPYWNDMLKGFSGLTVQNEMARAVLSANPTDRQLRELAKQGISGNKLKQLRHYLDKYGEDGDLFVPNGDNWVDEILPTTRDVKRPDGTTEKIQTQERVSGEDMRKLWRSAVGKTVNEIIVTPGIGEMPLWVTSPAAQLIMQFKSFPISAHSRVMISGLQARDKEALSGLLMGAALGGMVLETKAALNGTETTDNAGDYAFDAMDRAGFFGWLNEPIQIASKVTRGQLAPNRLWGGEQANTSRYQSRNLLGSILGPSADLVGDLSATSGAIATGDFSDGDVSAARKMLPFQNLFYFKWLLDHLQER